jgi:hypothetical protein
VTQPITCVQNALHIITPQQLLRRRCHFDVHIHTVLQAVIPANPPKNWKKKTKPQGSNKRAHDVAVERLSKLACQALQQLHVFARETAPDFVLHVHDADKSILPAGEGGRWQVRVAVAWR